MPAKLNLRDRLDDCHLDLSMSQLEEVPVKEIAAIKKATSLELSNNSLVILPKNFPTLTHLIKLDLSKNHLTELPENFGDLVNLKHLDLYNNQLERVPLSFGNLNALRWLDLKNNPLIPVLAKVAGSCLDNQSCQKCGRNVVKFMKELQQQVETERMRRQTEQREADAAEAAANQAQKKEPKKKKKSKADKAAAKLENDVKQANATKNASKPKSNSGGISNGTKAPPVVKPAKKSFFGKAFSFVGVMFRLVFYMLLLSAVATLSLYLFAPDKFIYVQKEATKVMNATVQAMPPWMIEGGQDVYVAARPYFMTTYRVTKEVLVTMMEKIRSGYEWMVVQVKGGSLEESWNSLCIRVGVLYENLSKEVPVYIDTVKKKLFSES